MTVALGIFEIFAYIVPGSVLLGLSLFVTDNLGPSAEVMVAKMPAGLIAVMAVIASYILGHIANYAADRLYHLPALERQRAIHVRAGRDAFIAKVSPAVAVRPFVDVDRFILLAGIEAHNKDMAADISKFHTISLMLRNVVIPLALSAISGIFGVFVYRSHLDTLFLVLLLCVTAVTSAYQSNRFHYYVVTKTLEVAMWVPGLDQVIAGAAAMTAEGER